MSTIITPSEDQINITITDDTVNVNVNNEQIVVNVTEEIINVSPISGAYPLPTTVYSVFGRTGAVVGEEGDYNLNELGDVTLSDETINDVLTWDGTEWINQQIDFSPYVPYTGATGDVNLGEHGLLVGQVTFDQTPTGVGGVGIMRWNDTDGTVDLGLKGGNVTLQLGQEIVARVVNKTGSDLLESGYKAVRISSAQGQRLAVQLAQANNDLNSVDTIGIVTETIANNQEGFITILGQVKEINTTGSLQGETWTDGDVLYLSPTTAGAITNVKPSAPNHMVVIGYVEYAHSQHGKIYCKVQNGYELEELHDVAPLPYINKGVLYRDTTTNLWKSDTIGALLGYTPANDSLVVHLDGIETITGDKTFDGITNFNSTIFNAQQNNFNYGFQVAKQNTRATQSGYMTISSVAGTASTLRISDGNSTADSILAFNNGGDYTYTFPAANGTIALTSNLSSYVPYSGATGAVNLGAYDLTVNGLTVGKGAGASLGNTAIGEVALSSNVSGYQNTAIGAYALEFNTTGFANTTNGSASLNQNTTGYYNTALGYFTLRNNTTGYSNTSVGSNSLALNTTGNSNTSVGDTSLNANTTGQANVAVGINALASNTTANLNTAIGSYALWNNTTGASNTAVGASALQSNTTGIRNTTLGWNAGTAISTGSYNTIIGIYSGTTAMSSNVILADGQGNIRYRFDGTNNNFYQNVNFSSTIGNGTYTYTLPGATGTLALTSDLTGYITAVTASSPLASSGGTTPNITIQQASGSQDGYLSSTDWNTFNGKQNALTNPVTGTGTTNYLPKFTGTSAIGDSLVYDNGTNVAIGTTTIGSKLQVNGNVAIGYSASTAAPTNGLVVNGTVLIGSTTDVGLGKIQSSGAISVYAGGDYWRMGVYTIDAHGNGTGGNFNIGTNSADNLVLITNNTARLTLSSTGAATFSSSVTASSLIKSGGTSTEILAADGSVITAGTNITISGGTISASGGGGSMAIGGSITSATAGSILFAGASGVLAQDNANLFWDDTNNRLGIGTTTIGSSLQINGSAAIGYSASTAGPTNGLQVAGQIKGAAGMIISGTNSDTYIDSATGNSLNFAYNSNAEADGWINYKGYNGGSTQFRNTIIANGKLVALLTITGSTGLAKFRNSVGINNPTAVGSSLQVNGNAAIGYSASTAAPTNGILSNGGFKSSNPTGGTAQTWKLGQYNATAPTATGYVEVEVNGVLYKLIAST